jgi:isoleucyl-tRNA synthetase
VVDGDGRKMSKSMGNVIAPQKVSDTLGADILRLWVASTDYSGELSISDTILKRVVESYRRLRNTLYFLLGNLGDFDPKKDLLPPEQLLEIDRYAIARAAQMQQEVMQDYDRYAFHPAVSRLVSFCSEDLGAFYLDILKDRLYTTKADSQARRAAQTALWHITESLTRCLSPFLVFTANEAWQSLHQKSGAETIFEESAYVFPEIAQANALIEKWESIRAVRAEVLRAIEVEREAGRVGSSLQAEATLTAGEDIGKTLLAIGEGLKYVLITSAAKVSIDAGLAPTSVNVSITPLTDPKCGRCWHLRPDVGQDAAHPHLCGRCISNLFGTGESRAAA